MKHGIATAIVLCGALFGARSVQATHFMGGELTYKWLGGLDYEMTLVIMRDCAGIAVGGSMGVTATSAFCGSTAYYLPAVDTVEVAVGCSSWISLCSGGSYPGAELHFFRDTVTLAGNCSDWVFNWMSCCRNDAIDNLVVDGADTDLYVEASLDNLNFPGNSSPVFQELPGVYTCIGTPFCIPNGGYDADGDSLVYAMVQPIEGQGVPISYNLGYSVADPFPSSTGHVFDPVTGNHCVTSSSPGEFVVAYEVDEYRGGMWVGRSHREFQLWVIACPVGIMDIVGVVNDTLGNPVSAGTVELYQYGLNSGGSLLVTTTPVGAGGTYAFNALPTQQYLVRAIPDTVNYPGTASSYHESSYYWTYADIITSTCDTTVVADVELVSTSNLNGTGYLSGFLGDLGIVRDDGSGVPWEDVSILLEHWPGQGAVAFTRTDIDGHFHFSNVPDGTYRILCDFPGLPMVSYYVVTVTAGSTVTELNYGADPSGFFTSGVITTTDEREPVYAVLAPNPVHQGCALIKGLPDGAVPLIITDASGRILFSAVLNSNGGTLQLPTAGLPAGVYSVTAGEQRFKLVKE